MKYYINDGKIERSTKGKPEDEISLKNVFLTKREAKIVRDALIRKPK